jgi:DNA-binding NtrC family response regulator
MVPSSLSNPEFPQFGVLCVNVDPSRLTFAGQVSNESTQPVQVPTVDDAVQLAFDKHTPVVVCREDAPGGGWQTLLQKVQTLPDPPTVIVYCSRQDPVTWAQVLNSGGFDVVSPSTSPDTILRTIRAAYERRCRQLEVNAARKTCVRALTNTFAQRLYA